MPVRVLAATYGWTGSLSRAGAVLYVYFARFVMDDH